jgi:hypothetical protein
MRTPPSWCCIRVALVALALVGCSNDDDPTIATAPVAAVTSPTVDLPLSTRNVPLGTNDLPVSPGATDDIPIPPLVSSDIAAPILIDVTVGVHSDPDRVESVALGAIVTLSITDPTSDDEFHLHGYDLGEDVTILAGQAETFTFVADQAGEFEVESHQTGDALMTLSVPEEGADCTGAPGWMGRGPVDRRADGRRGRTVAPGQAARRTPARSQPATQ